MICSSQGRLISEYVVCLVLPLKECDSVQKAWILADLFPSSSAPPPSTSRARQ